jgi:hypothetical protein
MRIFSTALVFLTLISAGARADEYILAMNVGGPYAVTPGGELARIQKQRPLPNAFGSADIFGRKVETGFVLFIYFGRAENGHAMIRRLDVDILSTATTMSRSPGFAYGQAWSNGQAWGTFSNGTGNFGASSHRGAQVFGMSPTTETNTVLPPRGTDFTIDPQTPLPLPTGHIITLHSVEPQRLVFSLSEPKAAKSLSKNTRGNDLTKPAAGKPSWAPW